MFQTQPRSQSQASPIEWTDAEWKATIQRFLRTSDPEAAVRLDAGIRAVARCSAHGFTESEREAFAQEAPLTIMYRRDTAKTKTSRLEKFDLEKPFMPWLWSVLERLWISHLQKMRRAVVNGDLLHDVTVEADAPDDGLPEWSEAGRLTEEVCDRLEKATNEPRLLVFLAMSGLHRHFRRWEELLHRHEERTGTALSRPFPSMQVELHDTPRTRTDPLARELGIRKNNTLTQIWRRACADIRRAFPELEQMIPTRTRRHAPPK